MTSGKQGSGGIAGDEKHQARRILALLRHHPLDYQSTPIKRIAVYKLLAWQPLAKRIRFYGKCHCGNKYMLTYQQDGLDYLRGENEETCGYYCYRCGFGNAGSREVRS